MFAGRRAAFLAVGSELLRTSRVDTNSLWVGQQLLARGVELVEKRVVPDEEESVAAAVRELLSRVELVICSGGLGPTADDVTREGVARALNCQLREDPQLLATLKGRYARAGRAMPAMARRMAQVVEGAQLLPNPRGTAPGQWIDLDKQVLILLPGVPEELQTIWARHIAPRLEEGSFAVRTLRVGGRFESEVEERVQHLYFRFGRQRVTILAGPGLVDLILLAKDPDQLATMEAAFAEVLGEDLFGRDEDTLQGCVVSLLREKQLQLVVAESCTGGLLAGKITEVPGASEVFVGGVVAYANHVKVSALGVEEAALAQWGAVSEPVAVAMAKGALQLGAQVVVAITGIAGPGGGSEGKPVGTVHVVVAAPWEATHRRFQFSGSRQGVREQAVNFSLDLLRRTLRRGP